MKKISITLIALFLIISAAFSALKLPEKPQAWLSDYAGVLTTQQKEQLNGVLNDLEKRTSNQIFIAIFKRIPEDTYLEDFASRLFEKWRPGLPNKDNGLLITIFTEDRKAKIEVGYGLEDVVTDAQARRVLYNYMIPYFKKGDYFSGLAQGLNILIPAVEGKYHIPLKNKTKTKNGSDAVGWLLTILAFIFFFGIFGRRRSAGIGTRHRGTWMGPFFFGGFGGGESSGGGFGGFGGGGFSGGFGGMSGGGGASGSW